LKRNLADYSGITLGAFITAMGLGLFEVPNRIAAGGISGLSTVIHYLTGWPVGLTMLALNLPLFLAGFKVMGRDFEIKSLYGTITLSLFTDLVGYRIPPPTADPLLAAIYGGLLCGLGLGVVFRCGGSTGGTDLAALIFTRYFPLTSGMGLLFIDAVVITLAGIVFSTELALYALLSLIIASRTIDAVQEGGGYAKAVFIISRRPEEIAQRILGELQRGVTGLEGRGLYTRRRREVLLVVVQRAELSRLKALVAEMDPRAFVIVSDTHEVLGEGFRPWSIASPEPAEENKEEGNSWWETPSENWRPKQDN